jgi:hypothetical protein
MKPQRVTSIVIHEDIPEYGEPGEAQLLLPDGQIRYIAINHPSVPALRSNFFKRRYRATGTK